MAEDKKKIIQSSVTAVAFILVIWLIKLFELSFDSSFVSSGIKPRTLHGIAGIIFAPFIHADFDHLLSNTIPLLVAGIALSYFYNEIRWQVVAMIWLFTGFWTWLIARPTFHIGASGLIYGFITFLFFSGLFRKNKHLTAISLLIAFLYGSMVWGILPVNQLVSWESHLCGSIAGIFAAVYFRKLGPVSTQKQWDPEPEPTGPEYWMTEEQKSQFPTEDHSIEVHYTYKEEKK